MAEEGCPLIINQPSYSIVNRWVEEPRGWRLPCSPAADSGLASSPSAGAGSVDQPLLNGVPDLRGAMKSLSNDMLSAENPR